MPKLIVTRGRNPGEYNIPEKLTLGRSVECDITLDDIGVSRQHAEIVKAGDAYIIRDLNSRNGTFVDGERVNEVALEDGNRISIANWTAIFKDGFAAHVGAAAAKTIKWLEDNKEFRAAASSVEKTIAAETQDRALEALHVTGSRVLHDKLKLLDDIGHLIRSLRDTDDLLNEIARQCLVVFADCDSCVILFNGPAGDDLSVKAALLRTKDGIDFCSTQTDIHLSRAIIKRALENKESIFRSGASHDVKSGDVASVADFDARSFLCAPLIRGGEAFGVIYLDSRHVNAKLSEADLWLLSAIASGAALAIENAQLHLELKLAKEYLEDENRKFRQEVGDQFRFEGIIGTSSRMRDAIERAKRAAPTDASVLITGESGVGKELFARAIHCNSRRSAGPFETFNCALGESLIETELFGIGPWAATGVKPRPGLFERANGGTVFLDEIGDMPLDTQAKLLRVLQDGTVRRTGAAKNIAVSIRIIVATNRDLEAEIEAGRFRNDLYHRVAAVRIHVPPLRERREDILKLAEYFLMKYSLRYGREIEGFSLSAQQAMASYSWKKNNVRELEKRVEEMVTLAHDAALIHVKDLPPEIARAGGIRVPRPAKRGPLKEVVAEVEKEIIIRKLRETRGRIKRVARELGVSHQGLRNKIEDYGLWEQVEEARGH